MSFINCKVESKLRWAKHFVLVSACVENADANSKISFLLSKTQNHLFLYGKIYIHFMVER